MNWSERVEGQGWKIDYHPSAGGENIDEGTIQLPCLLRKLGKPRIDVAEREKHHDASHTRVCGTADRLSLPPNPYALETPIRLCIPK